MITSDLLPPQSASMRAAMAFGNVAVRAFLMCASRTPTSVPNETRTSLKSWLSVRRKRRKKDKYLRACHEMRKRKDFTPLVYSVDGIAGREAKNAERRIATILLDKWQRPYSGMVQYASVDSNCSCASKQPAHPWESSAATPSSPGPLIAGAAMWDWWTWPDR
ncbi:hypothetical protein ACHAXR_005870 [Thalassiosira sp. AJA248-18]